MKVTVIVGTDKGGFLLRSDEARKSWNLEGPFFKGWKVTTSARTPSGRWLAGTASFVYGAAIQASDDLKEWSQIESGPAYPEGGINKLNQIWTLRTGEKRHYAGVDTAGMFYSDDDASTWHPVATLNDHPTRPNWFPGNGGLCAHSIVVDPQNSNRIWCGISAVGCWRSDDGGDTWHAKNEGVPLVIEDKTHKDIGYCIHALALDPDDPNTIYRQDHRGFFRRAPTAATRGRCFKTACRRSPSSRASCAARWTPITSTRAAFTSAPPRASSTRAPTEATRGRPCPTRSRAS
jgi:hypothetical protein